MMKKEKGLNLTELFRPIRIGNMELKNRIVMPPLALSYCDEYGMVTERLKAYYEARAKGGVALMISEMAAVTIAGRTRYESLMIHKDEVVPGFRELADIVHRHDGKFAVQLSHAGRYGAIRATHKLSQSCSGKGGSTLYSAQPYDVRALSAEELEDIAKMFGEAGRRAKEAGADAVEIHGAHGLLIHEFLSPLVNDRTDKYGGSFENRVRFPLEVYRSVRKEVGSDFPIIYRVSASEGVAAGLRIEESVKFCELLEREGVDLINVSSGTAVTDPVPDFPPFPPMAFPRGVFVQYAEAIKKAVKVPVMAVGRINDPVLANEILKEGKADLIGVARGILADPEFPRKAEEGRFDEIRPCIACMTCTHMLFRRFPVECLVNPEAGREREFALSKAETSKKVVIVGGGPAGLEAARVCTLRGHKVVLFEKGIELGGQLRVASVPPHKDEIKDLVKYLANQVTKLQVDIRLGEEATPRSVLKENPDAVILATGAKTYIPDVPGIDLDNAVMAWDVLTGKASNRLGKKIVIAGGGRVGCETAEFLAEKGYQVTIAEQLKDIGMQMEQNEKRYLLQRLKNSGVEIIKTAKIVEIKKDGIVLSTWGKEWSIPCDSVVVAMGAAPDRDFAQLLREQYADFFLIGDCVEPRSAKEAIYEGGRIAREI